MRMAIGFFICMMFSPAIFGGEVVGEIFEAVSEETPLEAINFQLPEATTPAATTGAVPSAGSVVPVAAPAPIQMPEMPPAAPMALPSAAPVPATPISFPASEPASSFAAQSVQATPLPLPDFGSTAPAPATPAPMPDFGSAPPPAAGTTPAPLGLAPTDFSAAPMPASLPATPSAAPVTSAPVPGSLPMPQPVGPAPVTGVSPMPAAPVSAAPGFAPAPMPTTGVAPAMPQQFGSAAPLPAFAPAPAPAPLPALRSAPTQKPVQVEADRPTSQAAVPSELKGIDTLKVDEPGGNWLVKRMWWEKAEEKMDNIEKEVENIMQSRMAFFEKRDKADSKVFDPFYSEVGLDQGQLEMITSYFIDELKEMREKKDALDREGRAFLQKLQDEKRVLKQTKVDVQAIKKLDDSLDNAVTKLLGQVNLAAKYRREAREFFKEIGKTLDHNKARELFHEIQALWQSIKKVGKYISGELSQSFEQVIANAKTQTDRIKAAVDQLEKKGLDFRKKFDELESKAEDKKEEEEKQKRRALLKEQFKEEKEEPGIFSRTISAISVPFVAIGDWIASFWGKKEELAPAPEPLQDSAVVQVPEPAVSTPVVPEKKEKK